MEKISREAREINYANFARELDTLLASSTDQVLSVCEVLFCVKFQQLVENEKSYSDGEIRNAATQRAQSSLSSESSTSTNLSRLITA